MRREQRREQRDQDVEAENDEADACLLVAPQCEDRANEEPERSWNWAGRNRFDLDLCAGDLWRRDRADDAHVACRTRGSRRTYRRSTMKIVTSMLTEMTRNNACISGKSWLETA